MITEAALKKSLEELRSRVGIEVPVRGWNREATADAIWHFALGMGDSNPLWLDPTYADGTKWGINLAPPTFLYSCSSYSSTAGAVGLPGVPALWAEDDWRFARPVRRGEFVGATFSVKGIDAAEGSWGDLRQTEETVYRDSQSNVVARAKRTWTRRHRKQDSARREVPHVEGLTTADVDALLTQYRDESPRGSTPRYWNDVEVGDSLGQILKGPLTVTELITWLAGCGAFFLRASRDADAYRIQHPAAYSRMPGESVPDTVMRWHWDDGFARSRGLATVLDFGNQRISWFAHLLTDWMGDSAELRRLRVRLRRPHYIGDVLKLSGAVSAKKVSEQGEPIVECNIHGHNYRGELIADGLAEVMLPDRPETR